MRSPVLAFDSSYKDEAIPCLTLALQPLAPHITILTTTYFATSYTSLFSLPLTSPHLTPHYSHYHLLLHTLHLTILTTTSPHLTLSDESVQGVRHLLTYDIVDIQLMSVNFSVSVPNYDGSALFGDLPIDSLHATRGA